MAEQPILDVQEGIWIDKRWLQQAGLGERLQIAIVQGEIRILAAPEAQKLSDSAESVWTEEATETFCSLWRDAEPGKLHNASENHDLYLYGKGT